MNKMKAKEQYKRLIGLSLAALIVFIIALVYSFVKGIIDIQMLGTISSVFTGLVVLGFIVKKYSK